MEDNQTNMALAITGAINALFDNESELKQYEWNSIDLTQFFTAYIKAGNHIFNTVTGGSKNNLEFTHLANSLIFQDAMKGNPNLIDEDDEEV